VRCDCFNVVCMSSSKAVLLYCIFHNHNHIGVTALRGRGLQSPCKRSRYSNRAVGNSNERGRQNNSQTRVVPLLLSSCLFAQYVNIVMLFLWEPQPPIYVSWILFRNLLRSCVALLFHLCHLVAMLVPLVYYASCKICCVGILFRAFTRLLHL